MITKAETYPILDLMLKGFMEDELKWFPLGKAAALDELDSIKSRVNRKSYPYKRSKRQSIRKYNRLKKWKKEYPFHRSKSLYTTFIAKYYWEVRRFHVQFNTDKLRLRITFTNGYYLPEKVHSFFTHPDRYLEITDEDYPSLVTLLYLVAETSLVQNTRDIPMLELES